MKSEFSLLRFLFSIIVIGIFTGCYQHGLPTVYGCYRHGLPTVDEHTSALTGKKIVVLLRITCEAEDGTSVEPFPSGLHPHNINIGLGNFLIGGKVKRVKVQRFLSPETRKQGWTYLILEPGIHYIVFQTDLFGLPHAPKFRASIFKNNPLVYIGTLHLYCHSRTLLFEGKYCYSFETKRIDVLNEESLAKKLATEYLSNYGSPQTLLMERFY